MTNRPWVLLHVKGVKFHFIVLTIGVTFLCPHKKVTKESGWGMC